ncbi:extensin-like domain-containing protein [Rhizobium sp. C4]|uniref:extensin-like domain-containing protein n=1 Tax=Rhizobium sp. C4 TaxID=1349800 RepID=UPI001E63045E|nr:extensin family protein [Rhizobium sp. C4]MCD2171594.1 extensin family protein [Rhizobium sp. C4]
MSMVFSTSLARSASSAALACLILSGCYDSDPMSVADIGPRGKTHAVPLAPVRSPSSNVAYPILEGPVGKIERSQRAANPNQDLIELPETAPSQAPLNDAASQPLPAATEANAAAKGNEVDMDKLFGFSGQPAQQGQQDQGPQIAEGDVDAPVIDGVGTDNLRDVSKTRSIPVDDAVARPAEVQEQKVAYIPRFNDPMSVPESHGGMPASEKSCRQTLQKLGVVYADIPGIHDGPSCGIDYPVQVQSINGVRILPAAKLNCGMAVTFARWVKDDLVPTARIRYFSGVNTIRQMSSYSCRPMNSKRGNPWSEHAKGNAIDVGQIILNNGEGIDVRKPGFFSFRQKGLLNSVRADSCKYFNTVLGPGDPYHGDHFHFDLRSRKSGRRYCSLD